ncbi:MAG: hypothetical protein U1E73_12425 [Planctomycetota bacterium]
MKRPQVLLLAVVALIAVATALFWNGFEPAAPVAPPPGNAAAPGDAVAEATKSEPAPAAAAAATEANASREAVASESDPTRLPIPADALWLDVHIVDAGSKAPVPGALVRWSNGAVWPEIQKVPERERQALYEDQELAVERFGWQTRANAEGIVKIAADQNGAQVFAYSEGRYGSAYVGGRREVPAEGWRLELEADLALRVQVFDAKDRPAIDVDVGILFFDEAGKPKPNYGWVRPVASNAPDGIAEFRHVQTWLRGWGSGEAKGFTCRAALRVPGCDDPGVAFDRAAPPPDPVVLHLPATGSLRARLLHEGRPLVRDARFGVWRGPDDNNEKSNTARRVFADDDGWARFPHVGLGGTLTVTGSCGTGEVQGEVQAPVAAGQEVSIELDADSIFSLAGMLVGPGGVPLANANVSTEYDAEIQMGGGSIKTDEKGRFFWLMAKGYVDKPTLKRLVLSMQDENGSPLRASVPQRTLTRGVNDLGVIQLAAGPLVAKGRIVFEAASTRQANFTVEALADARGRNGEEQWRQLRDLTTTQRPDGTFEVRGETRPVRHRLNFPAYDHLPIEPVEFRIGQDDIVVTLVAGCDLTAKVLVPEGLGRNAVRGVLVPHDQVAPEPKGEPWSRRDRYTAQPFGSEDGIASLRWNAVPSGTYRLEIVAGGMSKPVAVVDDVVLPQPAGGDPRLAAIDVRDAVRIVKIVGTPPDGGAKRYGEGLVVFLMPQDDDKGWVGTQLPLEGGTLLVPQGPLELFVTSPSCRPQRFQCTGAEMQLALEPWPTVEVTVGNLPPLPEGVELHLSLWAPRARDAKEIRFRTENRSGVLSTLLAPQTGDNLVVDGRVRLPVADGQLRVTGYVMAKGNRKPQTLRTLTPSEITGGEGLAPFTVQLSTEELQQALAELQGAKK